IEGWKLDPYFRSAREVAGDFYDIFTIEGHSRVGFIVADVCDKGVGAALFMTLFRSLLRSTAKMHEYADVPDAAKALYIEQPDLLLKRCVEFTNNYIASTHGHTSMFATMFFGLLEPETGHIYYINAGHEAPLILKDGAIRTKLENTGPVVGLFQNSDYRVDEAQLEKGETLFAYTDGVTDAVNKDEQSFTEDRLMSLLVEGPQQDLTATVVSEIQKHMDGHPQFDDVTILTVNRD
ncbi:MAG: serine/threonine-protein phosphatase, partial [Sphingomonadales bacterium]|nr:serine/threonine-protein phosphatase [Sphingomonadales bacterium]